MSAAMAPPRRIVPFIVCGVSLVGSLIIPVDLGAANAEAPAAQNDTSTPPMRCPAPSAVREALARGAALPEAGAAPSAPAPLDSPNEDVEVSSDAATLGVAGDAALSGRVSIRQGDRTLSADEVAELLRMQP